MKKNKKYLRIFAALLFFFCINRDVFYFSIFKNFVLSSPSEMQNAFTLFEVGMHINVKNSHDPLDLTYPQAG